MSRRNTKAYLYDKEGKLLVSKGDHCDCENVGCEGCFFPCPKCKSIKCGPICRRYRKYVYDYYEVEGTSVVHKNTKE